MYGRKSGVVSGRIKQPTCGTIYDLIHTEIKQETGDRATRGSVADYSAPSAAHADQPQDVRHRDWTARATRVQYKKVNVNMART